MCRGGFSETILWKRTSKFHTTGEYKPEFTELFRRKISNQYECEYRFSPELQILTFFGLFLTEFSTRLRTQQRAKNGQGTNRTIFWRWKLCHFAEKMWSWRTNCPNTTYWLMVQLNLSQFWSIVKRLAIIFFAQWTPVNYGSPNATKIYTPKILKAVATIISGMVFMRFDFLQTF